ncbi:hypothetical protein DITRI_Ditri05aG0010400 [Diplodiscus trichospermus]
MGKDYTDLLFTNDLPRVSLLLTDNTSGSPTSVVPPSSRNPRKILYELHSLHRETICRSQSSFEAEATSMDRQNMMEENLMNVDENMVDPIAIRRKRYMQSYKCVGRLPCAVS